MTIDQDDCQSEISISGDITPWLRYGDELDLPLNHYIGLTTDPDTIYDLNVLLTIETGEYEFCVYDQHGYRISNTKGFNICTTLIIRQDIFDILLCTTNDLCSDILEIKYGLPIELAYGESNTILDMPENFEIRLGHDIWGPGIYERLETGVYEFCLYENDAMIIHEGNPVCSKLTVYYTYHSLVFCNISDNEECICEEDDEGCDCEKFKLDNCAHHLTTKNNLQVRLYYGQFNEENVFEELALPIEHVIRDRNKKDDDFNDHLILDIGHYEFCVYYENGETVLDRNGHDICAKITVERYYHDLYICNEVSDDCGFELTIVNEAFQPTIIYKSTNNEESGTYTTSSANDDVLSIENNDDGEDTDYHPYLEYWPIDHVIKHDTREYIPGDLLDVSTPGIFNYCVYKNECMVIYDNEPICFTLIVKYEYENLVICQGDDCHREMTVPNELNQINLLYGSDSNQYTSTLPPHHTIKHNDVIYNLDEPLDVSVSKEREYCLYHRDILAIDEHGDPICAILTTEYVYGQLELCHNSVCINQLTISESTDAVHLSYNQVDGYDIPPDHTIRRFNDIHTYDFNDLLDTSINGEYVYCLYHHDCFSRNQQNDFICATLIIDYTYQSPVFCIDGNCNTSIIYEDVEEVKLYYGDESILLPRYYTIRYQNNIYDLGATINLPVGNHEFCIYRHDQMFVNPNSGHTICSTLTVKPKYETFSICKSDGTCINDQSIDVVKNSRLRLGYGSSENNYNSILPYGYSIQSNGKNYNLGYIFLDENEDEVTFCFYDELEEVSCIVVNVSN